MKTVDTKEFLGTLCEMTDSGKTVSTVVSGGSMAPFLCANRDFVFLQKPHRKLKKGDIVLFNRENGDFVLHRILRIKEDEFYLCGDRQTTLEGPVKEADIRCIAVSAKRKDSLITEKSPVWWFYGTIWSRLVFMRPLIFRLVSLIKK